MSTTQDLYALPGSWRPFAEHREPLALDFTTEGGGKVTLRGEAHVWHGSGDTGRAFITAGAGCPAAGLDLWEVSAVLTAAVLDRLIGSDTLRKAVDLEWSIGSAAANGVS